MEKSPEHRSYSQKLIKAALDSRNQTLQSASPAQKTSAFSVLNPMPCLGGSCPGPQQSCRFAGSGKSPQMIHLQCGYVYRS